VNRGIYFVVIAIIAIGIISFIFYYTSDELITPQEPKFGNLEGTVNFIGTACPGERKGPPCSGPYPNYEIIIYNEDGKTVEKTIFSNEDGNYNTELEQGVYVIFIQEREFGTMKETPNQITINSDQITQFDITIDTGIR